MKFVLACYGTRGDVEPGVAVALELVRRGHEACMAVSPDLVGFVEAAGLAAVAYGPDTQVTVLEAQRNAATFLPGKFWRIHDHIRVWREVLQLGAQRWMQMSATLTSMAHGADLLLTAPGFEDVAANVAEYYDIPLVTLQLWPVRVNGQLIDFLPALVIRFAMTALEWLGWRWGKKLINAQRRELNLPKATRPTSRRIAERGSLEIQAYDEFWFPGLAAEWAKWNGRRPFVGALTREVATDAEEEVASWIAAGTPPIFFGFGSTHVGSPADTLAMISGACARLGERALVCSGWTDFGELPHFEHVKVVGAMNYAAAFPACRAVVHHGGAGTTAIGLRAGIPVLVLWTGPDQAIWGGRVKRLKVGTARRFSRITQQSLLADLRLILAPHYAARAREIAARMSKPAESVAAAADLMESFARARRVG